MWFNLTSQAKTLPILPTEHAELCSAFTYSFQFQIHNIYCSRHFLCDFNSISVQKITNQCDFRWKLWENSTKCSQFVFTPIKPYDWLDSEYLLAEHKWIRMTARSINENLSTAQMKTKNRNTQINRCFTCVIAWQAVQSIVCIYLVKPAQFVYFLNFIRTCICPWRMFVSFCKFVWKWIWCDCKNGI